jgi:DNA uptake protein ComE-like DNA-binding protein
MNRYFDFTSRQLRFAAILSLTVIVMATYLLVRSWAAPNPETKPFELFIGDPERQFTGVFVLDPNSAPADSLELLPGIGPVLADRIVSYRQQEHFETEIDITEVRGIGPKLYERLRPYLKVQRR